MSSNIDISVVIGFRNWGQRRLQLAVKSILESFGPLNGEVIVSDYGSDDNQVTEEGMTSVGARYIYTETDGSWSRSRALNAGFAHARGRILVSTDADMIFSPKSFEVIGQTLLQDPSLCLLLQCRDLPQEWSDVEVAEAGFEWTTFEAVSRLRPRWGMGGMMAVHRSVYARIRGLDERMHTYGGEDIDFATRAKRAGQRLLWLENPEVRMYHMWHQPTRAQVEVTREAREAIEYNKSIVYNDPTFVRNTKQWAFPLQGSGPLVSVAIATRNRAEYLSESIVSVLGQTMQDFEIVVVDDGSTDNTKEVVESFKDSRIRYFYQEHAGVSAARNRAADESRGVYTAVHDDDDLMTPWRLQSQLDVISAGVHGSFGAFVNFNDSTGQMELYRAKIFTPGTINETGGAPGHGTWLIETSILKKLRYDESLSSGVDNNLALRMVRSGFRFVHSGEIVMLRRLHDSQITIRDEHTQKLAARQTRLLFSFGTSSEGAKKMKEQRGPEDWPATRNASNLNSLLPYLPDHLVMRQFAVPQLIKVTTKNEYARVEQSGEYLGSLLPSQELSASDLAGLTSQGELVDLIAVLRDDATSSRSESTVDSVQKFLESRAFQILATEGSTSSVVIICLNQALTEWGNDFFNFVETIRITKDSVVSDYSFYLNQNGNAWSQPLTTPNSKVHSVYFAGEASKAIRSESIRTLKGQNK